MSPYTVCFQTLPDHWRLVERIGRAADRPQDNLLPSGDFEDPIAVVNEWTRSQHAVEGVQASAVLVPSAHQGKHCLQLIAGRVPGVDPPIVIPKAPVSVTSPPVPVRAGQVLYISGWIRIVSPVTGSLDGVTVHDNLGGMLGALRFVETAGGWQRFQLLRDVHEDAELRLAVNLNGMGEVLLDDLKIIPHWDRSNQAAGGRQPAPFTQNSPPRRFWNPLESLRPREALEPLDGASR